jgi:DNA-binding MarR family transcriptional regulator
MARKKDTNEEAELTEAKAASTLQLLFKAARLVDEEALRRIAAIPGRPRLRRSHTALLPHIDLDGTRVSDLAERVGVTKQAVSQLLDDLEGAGVVSRIADPADARGRLVVFTAAGRRGILEGLAVLARLEAELREEVGSAAMDGLAVGVRAVVEVLGADAGKPRPRPPSGGRRR